MKNIKLTDIIIDDFILGRLSEEESQTFRDKMEKDTGLLEQVEMRRSVIEGLEASGRAQLKNELKSIHEEFMLKKAETAKKGRIFPFLAMAAAAAIALILTLPSVLFPDQKQDASQLYAAYFKPYDIESSQRSENKETLFQFKKLYKSGAYAEALPLIEAELNAATQRSVDLTLAAGTIHLALDDTDRAIDYFEEIIAKADIGLGDTAQWYKALAQLKAKQLTQAQKSLEVLVADEYADFHQEAMALTQKIDLLIK